MQRGSVDHQETYKIPESQEFGPIWHLVRTNVFFIVYKSMKPNSF